MNLTMKNPQILLNHIKKAFFEAKKAFVELRGFEPRTFALPARRSSQLSYSPEGISKIPVV